MVQAHSHHHHHVDSTGDDLEESSQHQQHTQQGESWSHWWSYDGISGPDYWNINKHWRLCTLGRKQSPVNVRTDRLVYDHLLGPIQLNWRRNYQQEQHQHAKRTGLNQLDSQPADGKHGDEPNANLSSKQQPKSVQLKLVNSGRGIEAWLESGEGVALKEEEQNEHLYLGRGPLSYDYKLYKIELHSAASQPVSSGVFSSSNSLDKPSSTGGEINRHAGAGAHSGVASSHLAAHSVTARSSSGGGGGSGSAASKTNNLNKIDDNIIADRRDNKKDNDVGRANVNAAASENADQESRDGDDGDDGDEIVPEAVRAAPKTSEHLIDGRPFAGEVQLHFYNRQLAPSAQEALRLANEQPLASLFSVISVFISLKRQAGGSGGISVGGASGTQTKSPFETETEAGAAGAASRAPGVRAEAGDQLGVETSGGGPGPALSFILDNLHQVENQADSVELRVARSQINSLLTDKRNYVTYQGSMNRPPCAENVDWILLNRALQVDAAKFGQLFDKPSTNQDNIRPVRQLNGRLLRTTISLAGHAHAIDRHQLGLASIRSSFGAGEQVQEPALANCGHTQSDPSAKHNCTATTSPTVSMGQANKYGANQHNNKNHYHRIQQQQQGHQCNMRPNYVYQFTYGKL